jgi:hypothetical protein
MNASHIPNGTITALLAMVLVYFFPLASSALKRYNDRYRI